RKEPQPTEVVAMRVLLIEQHQLLSRALKQGLEEEGFSVTIARDAEEGIFETVTADHDVIILDPPRTKEDGLALLPRQERNGHRTPVLVLTTPGQGTGADFQGDDFLAIPFQLEELFARLRALTRH